MNKNQFQIAYGVVLIAVGIGVFLKIPYVMPKVTAIDYFANATLVIEFSFYLLGGLVILAGVKKIFKILNSIGDV
ncbi:MAG: hypothetical protein K8R67_13410 [Desulfobacteraceae bacterium]|nr:hypothetical protein [Desulfobacteraceae bacterium]